MAKRFVSNFGTRCYWTTCGITLREPTQALSDAREREHYFTTHVRPIDAWQKTALRDARQTLQAAGLETAPRMSRTPQRQATGQLPELAVRALTATTAPLPRVRLMRNAATGVITPSVPEAGEWGQLMARASVALDERASGIVSDTRRQWAQCRDDKCSCYCRCHAGNCYSETDSVFHYRKP